MHRGAQGVTSYAYTDKHWIHAMQRVTKFAVG
jgi:hypothetical protein